MNKNIGTSSDLALSPSKRYWIALEANANQGSYCTPNVPGIAIFDDKRHSWQVRPIRAF